MAAPEDVPEPAQQFSVSTRSRGHQGLKATDIFDSRAKMS